ncbi:protein phosphatase CheZ [Flexibacterium corallicola]|uniref:protein phosphatase CheZ n=1 Tax=Flexibacterium corallicola TaxID=3037259 RepID=UPI00286EEBF8|nr:protein phosphatase CheZ [Pseudovibrio sp. M1P-2-3]
MIAAKRIYRAEAVFGRMANENLDPDDVNEVRHRELLAEMAELKAMLAPQQTSESEVASISEKIVKELREEISEATALKTELDAISQAIRDTKSEIAALHQKAGSIAENKGRVAGELEAIVLGTEGATEQILSAAEFIDEATKTLAPMVGDKDSGLTNDIQEKVISIFEACNFQDLTGQRISKVVDTMSFIETRVLKMMEIWGGLETFKDIEVEHEAMSDDEALLHGPSLATDTDTVSQDDIDALFS